jgi:hypothetical protein
MGADITNCVQIGHLGKNEPDTEMAIADEIQNFKGYGAPQLTRILLSLFKSKPLLSLFIIHLYAIRSYKVSG